MHEKLETLKVSDIWKSASLYLGSYRDPLCMAPPRRDDRIEREYALTLLIQRPSMSDIGALRRPSSHFYS